MTAHKTDILVIGGGIAGSRAAIEASKNTSKVTLLVKGQIGKSGATASCGRCGISAVLEGEDKNDSKDEFLRDILFAGSGMCDSKLARILAYEASERVRELDSWGASLTKLKTPGCFHTNARSYLPKVPIMGPIIEKLKKTDVEVIEDFMVYDLLVKDSRCFGAVGVDKDGDIEAYLAKAVILATGGGGQLYRLNFNTEDITGDGYAMAYRAGAKLANMEFMQFGSNTVKPQIPDQRFWALKPRLYNAYGDEFIHKYIPESIKLETVFEYRARHYPFTTRHESKYLDIALQKEIEYCGGVKGSFVFADLTQTSRLEVIEFEKRYDVRIRRFGRNILREPFKVSVFHHAFNGGLVVNEQAMTNINGLFACGETITGPHGADRLGGNMISASLVFGARAGRFAGSKASKNVWYESSQIIDEKRKTIEAVFERKPSPISCEDISEKIQDTMSRYCTIVRTEEGLRQALNLFDRLDNVWTRISLNRRNKIKNVLSLKNLIDTGKLVLMASLNRRESRGSHFREDFPELRQRFSRPMVIQKK
ncbi:MAG: FAD-binding protein [Nitrososphaeria archaeon]